MRHFGRYLTNSSLTSDVCTGVRRTCGTSWRRGTQPAEEGG